MKIHVRITRDENADYFNVDTGEIVAVDFEQYVAAVVASEIGNSNVEACKAQAVASRTFAIRYIDSSISDSSSSAQAYRAARFDIKKYPNAIAGAQATEGQVLYYNNKPITAVFSASNGGATVSSKTRWGTNYPYLIEQPDPWDAAAGTSKTGHGVGMSQRGIKWAAAHDINYREMLQFYYPNTELRYDYGKITNVTVPLYIIDNLNHILNEIKVFLNNSEKNLMS